MKKVVLLIALFAMLIPAAVFAQTEFTKWEDPIPYIQRLEARIEQLESMLNTPSEDSTSERPPIQKKNVYSIGDTADLGTAIATLNTANEAGGKITFNMTIKTSAMKTFLSVHCFLFLSKIMMVSNLTWIGLLAVLRWITRYH